MLPRYLLSGIGPVPVANINAIADGNSWVANFYSSDAAHGFVQLVGAAVGLSIRNVGVGSRFITTDPLNPNVRTSGNNMMFNAPTLVDPYLDPTKLNVLFAFEGINTGIGGFTSQQIYNAWVAYYQQRKAAAATAGAKLHVCHLTACPAWIGIDPNETVQSAINALNANMIGCNALVRANPAPMCDSYVDLAAIPQFTFPDFLPQRFDNSAIYYSDRVHPIDPGHALLAAKIVADQRKWRRNP